VLEGQWAISTTQLEPRRYGANYQVAWRDGEIKRAMWLFTVPEHTEYYVYAWWPPSSSYATNVKFTVFGESTSFTTLGNQTDTSRDDHNNPDHWRKLGEAIFAPSKKGRIEITCEGSDGKPVIADAIRLARPGQYTESLDLIGYLYLGHRPDLPGDKVDPDLQLPRSIRSADGVSGTPLIVDMYGPERNTPWAVTHNDGIHALFLDGRVDWLTVGEIKPRWRDEFNNTFHW
jgi:prepilin-type processing-associated H-X9-DG protein